MKTVFKNEQGRGALMQFYDGMLSCWPMAHTEQDVQTRFGTTHVLTAGDPSLPPCVLLHGAASNAVTWMADAVVLSQRFHIIAPDLPGEVGKSVPVRPSWWDGSYALWLGDVLNGLNVDKAVIVGLSLGGWAALRFAVEFPGRVAKMVLISPGGIVPARLNAVLHTIINNLSGPSGAAKMKRMVFGKAEVPPEVGAFFDLIQQAYIPRFGSPPTLSRSELKRVDCPVMVFAPDQDTFFPFGKAQKRLDGLDRFRLILQHASHGLVGLGAQILPFLLE